MSTFLPITSKPLIRRNIIHTSLILKPTKGILTTGDSNNQSFLKSYKKREDTFRKGWGTRIIKCVFFVDLKKDKLFSVPRLKGLKLEEAFLVLSRVKPFQISYFRLFWQRMVNCPFTHRVQVQLHGTGQLIDNVWI